MTLLPPSRRTGDRTCIIGINDVPGQEHRFGAAPGAQDRPECAVRGCPFPPCEDPGALAGLAARFALTPADARRLWARLHPVCREHEREKPTAGSGYRWDPSQAPAPGVDLAGLSPDRLARYWAEETVARDPAGYVAMRKLTGPWYRFVDEITGSSPGPEWLEPMREALTAAGAVYLRGCASPDGRPGFSGIRLY